MIIVRSPLRITLGGGGTDLPSYYRGHEGFVVAAAIDKYVYVTVTRPFSPGIYLKYSALEHVAEVAEVRHPIIREALALQKLVTPQIEITTLADIPAGTGLGSSASFSTALLKGLHAFRHRLIHPQELAELACHLEIDLLGEPVGKQDQYVAAYGGLTCLTFHKDERVTAEPLHVSMNTMFDLEDNLLMVEGAVPGPRDGYVLISKAKAPPRERRGFAGSGTVDPLKASKKASAKKK